MKRTLILTLTGSLLILAGCGSAPVELPVSEESTFSLGQTYTIGSGEATQQNVYGLVVGDNLKNIFSNIGGFVTDLDCQPGKKVTAGTLIATITPNEDDPTVKNFYLQQDALQEQLDNLQASYDLTEQNFEFQKQSLQAQADNNQNIYDQDSADLEKLQHSIQNFKDQQINTIEDAFKKIRTSGGSTKNSNLYDDLYDLRDEVQDFSDDEFSQYLEDMAQLCKKASKYASGDALYATFMGLSNGFLASKSAFDTLIDTYASAQNAYDNQHDTLGMNLDLVDAQLQTIENTQEIQLNALDSQMQTIQQNLDALSNNLQGEDLYAEVDGIVKAKLVGLNNKVGPSTMICQIVPTDTVGKKIQIYSANKIPTGQIVKVFAGDVAVGAAKIQYELPYKDPVTQNYIYEIIDPNIKVKEGDRLTVQFFQKMESNEVRVPVSFVFSKLDGNYIRIQGGSGFVETKVDLGDINGTLVRVMSGASLGQTIVN